MTIDITTQESARLSAGSQDFNPFMLRQCSWRREVDERHRIIYIVYHGTKPHSVVTVHPHLFDEAKWNLSVSDWDFDYCRRDKTLYYHNSGGGGDGRSYKASIGQCYCDNKKVRTRFWADESVRMTRWNCKTGPKEYGPHKYVLATDADLKRVMWERLDKPLLLNIGGKRSRNPFDVADETDSHLVYCDRCRDFLPDESVCSHLVWCDNCLWIDSETGDACDGCGKCTCYLRGRQ